jgi:hypothetical protein
LIIIVSTMECHYELLSFGIPMRAIPTSIMGRLKTEDHQAWLQTRKATEVRRSFLRSTGPPIDARFKEPAVVVSDASTSEAFILPSSDSGGPQLVVPARSDVLFGRGKVKEHPGNIRLHELINSKRSWYEMAEKWEKTVIAEEIVAIIRDSQGRFLKVASGDEDGWIEVDIETAREKVSHTFRSRRPKTSHGSTRGKPPTQGRMESELKRRRLMVYALAV